MFFCPKSSHKDNSLGKGFVLGYWVFAQISGSLLFLFSLFIRIFSACNIITHFMLYKPHWHRVHINASGNAGPIFIFCDSKYWLGSCKNKLFLSTYSLATKKNSLLDSKPLRWLTWGGIGGAVSKSVCYNPSLALLSHQVIPNWKTVVKSAKSRNFVDLWPPSPQKSPA